MTKTRVYSKPRFYKESTIAIEGTEYGIRLDGRPVYTPAGNILSLPTSGMAKDIAAEWRGQKAMIDPASMPLTQLAITAIDRVAANRTQVIKDIVVYGGSDLLCYRAEGPIELVEEQAENWQPILDWLAQELGVYLKVTSGIVFLDQAKETMEALHRIVESFKDFPLTVVMQFTQVFTSLSLALAVAKGRLSWKEGIDLAFLEETFQARRWGQDCESIKRSNYIRKEVEQMAYFLEVCEEI